MGVFEVLASTDAEAQEHRAIKQAALIAVERAKRFDRFFEAGELDSRLAYAETDLNDLVVAACDECGVETTAGLKMVAAGVNKYFSGGHASDCTCGFCKNKGKLPGMDTDDDGDEDDDTQGAKGTQQKATGWRYGPDGEREEASVRDAAKHSFDYPDTGGAIEGEQADPTGPGGPIGEQLSDKDKGDNDDVLGGPIGENLSEQKGASVTPRMYVEFPWDHVASDFPFNYDDEEEDESDRPLTPSERIDPKEREEARKEEEENKKDSSRRIASFCDCDCEGCKDGGGHCESQKCIESKRTEASPLKHDDKTAADVETGDTFDQETVDLPTAGVEGLSEVGSPKIDKGSVPGDMAGNEGGLKPIDVPSKQHPVEVQDLGSDTPDYYSELPGVTETGKSVDADSPMQPEFNTADNTETWTGDKGDSLGQANPVTSKWIVLPPEAT